MREPFSVARASRATRAARDEVALRLVAWREALLSAWPLVLVVVLGFAVAFRYIKPAPPETLVLAAGPVGGAYDGFANRYGEFLRRHGIRLTVQPSSGAPENLQRLTAASEGDGRPPVEAGLVQGGLATDDTAPGLRTLGSVAYEPVWVFYRGNFKVDKLRDLVGWRIAVGAEGSGLRGLATQLMDVNELLADGGKRMLPLAGLEAAEALMQGNVDAAFIIAAPEEPVVQVLLRTPGVSLMSFAQADAYLRRFPFLQKIVLPQGAADLVRDFPPAETVLLATSTNLLVRADLHPAIQSLLLQAAREVHGRAGFFQGRGEFPAYKDNSLPLSPEADRFYRSGPPFLQRYLPFWAAVLVDRAVVLLLPAFALLFPLMRVAPAVYRWRVRSRIFRLYGDLKFLEYELRDGYDPECRAEYRQRLDHIDDAAYHRSVPLAFSDMVYTLREHIELVRKTLDKLEVAHPGGEAADAPPSRSTPAGGKGGG